MLRKISMLALLLPMLFSAKAVAYSNNNDCNTCCDSQWNVYADWLYWKPRSNALNYAFFVDPNVQRNNGITGNLFAVESSYESGFRVGLFYECNDLFYDLSYVRFHNSYANATENTIRGLISTREIENPFNIVDASWSFDYDTVDLLVGSKINHNCSCFNTRFFGGLKLVFIDQEFTTLNTSNDREQPALNSTSQKIKLDCYGLNFGIGMDYDFWSCLNFFTRISADVLLGNINRNYQLIDELQNININNLEDKFWNMVSAINLMIGLNYDYNFEGCWCGNLGISIGYEFHQYFGISDWLIANVTTSDQPGYCQNLSLDGLFLRVSLGF